MGIDHGGGPLAVALSRAITARNWAQNLTEREKKVLVNRENENKTMTTSNKLKQLTQSDR